MTRSVPANTVVGGNPARYICTIEEYANRNLKYNVKTYGLSSEKKKEILLSLPDSLFIKK